MHKNTIYRLRNSSDMFDNTLKVIKTRQRIIVFKWIIIILAKLAPANNRVSKRFERDKGWNYKIWGISKAVLRHCFIRQVETHILVDVCLFLWRKITYLSLTSIVIISLAVSLDNGSNTPPLLQGESENVSKELTNNGKCNNDKGNICIP